MSNRFASSVLFGVEAICICVISAGVALGAPPTKDTLTASAGTDSLGFSPTIPGNAPNQYFYAISVPVGAAVADTIPLTFSVSNTNAATPQNYTVTLHATGGLAGDVTFDNASFSIADDESAVLDNVYLNTVNLTAGDYVTNVQIAGTPADSVFIAHDVIHIHIHVAPALNAPSCFVTDSAGLLLLACDGATSLASGGAFRIVHNGKKITATNPGQFYYNLEWTNNTGNDQLLSFTLLGSNVLPQGANSVHYLVYDQTQFTQNVFDNVNANGTPCGPTGSTCTAVSVPDGQTLWLTWHAAYQYLGGTLWTDIPLLGACPAPSLHGTISMGATVMNSDPNFPVSFQCTGTASGYKLN